MRNFYFLFIIVLIASPYILQAQNICYGDVTLTTQEEVDAFDCEIIKGTLTITGPDIKNIHALSSLTTVGEHFIIGLADSLKDLDGLESLEKVTCSFELKNNFSLQNIEALGNLKRIGRNLTLIDNGVLTSLNGLQQIDSVLNLTLVDNPNLNFCCDLFPLVSNGGVYGYTHIEYNGSGCTEQAILNCSFNQVCDQFEGPVGAQNVCIGDLTLTTQAEMNAFDCEYVTGTLTITGNIFGTDSLHQLKGIGENLVIYQSALQSLGGLENLTDIGCSLIISNTFGLNNIGSLSNLTKVGHKIELRSNPGLTTLPYFEIDSLDELIVTDQPMLKYCCGLKDLIGKVSGNIEIHDNGPGCTATEILSGCETPPAGYCIGDFYINSQQQADEFSCEVITGNLNIASPFILSVDSLYTLHEIQGNFLLQQNPGFSFEGMNNLTTIDGEINFNAFNLDQTIVGEFNLDPLESLESVGSINITLGTLKGSLSAINSPMDKMYIGYTSQVEEYDWILNIPRIDSVIIENPNDNLSTNEIFSRVPEGGYVQIDGTLTDFHGFTGIKYLKTLDIYSGNAMNLIGLETLEKVDNFNLSFFRVKDDYCALYPFLKDGTVTNEFNWEGNYIADSVDAPVRMYVTVDDVLTNCEPEDITNSMSLYPNPVNTDLVSLNWKGDDSRQTVLQVIGPQGNTLMTHTLPPSYNSGHYDLPVQDLPSGTFLIRIITGEKVSILRLIRN